VVLIVQDNVGYVCDCAGVICGAIDIVDRDRISEGVRGDVIELRPLDVDEAASGTAVNEGLYASLDRGDTPQAPSPRVDRSRPKCSDVYRSNTQNADATTLRTPKVDDIPLSIFTIATPGDCGLSHL
jgi:hypothetical protein